MTAAFSRLQLAAALIEYDNDPTNPEAPFRSAHDSAIFAPLRRNPRPRSSTDFLGVALPSETGSLGRRESALSGGASAATATASIGAGAGGGGDRRSHGSIDALRNPFGPDETVDSEGDEDLEVDLTSWGLDSFIPKEKGSKNARSKSPSNALSNTQPTQSHRRDEKASADITQRRASGSRSLSVGAYDALGGHSSKGDSTRHVDGRRPSTASPINLVNLRTPHIPPLHNRHTSSHGLIETASGDPDSIPFPSRRPTSLADELESSSFMPPHDRSRPRSASLGSTRLLGGVEDNVFSVRPPSPDRASQFDPKASHTRNLSNGSRGLLYDENPFALRPPSVASKFDPKAAAHARTLSNASMGSRLPLDDDAVSVMTGYTRDRPYSTLELMRPKVLVMPSPLQRLTPPKPRQPVATRGGFQLSTDGPPLPPGARTGRISFAADPSLLAVPVASNVFTPNPRMSLSLSQLTFRNSLMVDGQRDVAYSDIDRALPRAVEDGEQIRTVSPAPAEMLPEIREPADPAAPGRPAGKLFGKSLIDDLEIRKSQLRNKQRVFTGDDRPSMMARRSSTLIDPASLQQQRPTPQRMHSTGTSNGPELSRRQSASMKPLLSFDDINQVTNTQLSADPRIPKSRSVFGVDTIWERELVKLREIEAREQLEAEEQRKRELEEEQEQKKKKNKGKKPKGVKIVDGPGNEQKKMPSPVPPTAEPSFTVDPPTLPQIPRAPRRARPPPVNDDDTDSESQASVDKDIRLISRADDRADQWISSDEEDEIAGRRPKPSAAPRPRALDPDDDSDEDIPLAATIGKVVQRANQVGTGDDDSDEESQPLSVLLSKTKLNVPSQGDSLSATLGKFLIEDNEEDGDDDDDDKPLGLRMSMAPSQSFNGGGEDDDDRPLAFHPEQQRRTQYNMMAAQQQMMMQAHLHSSMFFGATPNMMAPGFFAPTMGNPMMMAPAPLPVPSPPLHDAGKFVQVDEWRRNVAVQGEMR